MKLKEDDPINRLVEQGINGDKHAVSALVEEIRDKIYNLSLRMLYQPSDAEDATQEILIKVITRLSGFRKECNFFTWTYRIAVNHLITMKKKISGKRMTDLDSFKENTDEYLNVAIDGTYSDAEKELLAKEVRLSCLHGVLLYLDIDLRMAYILGDLFGVTSREGALILGITESAYRKRLSRARQFMADFMSNGCGLIDRSNPCTCERLMGFSVNSKWVKPDNLLFAAHPVGKKACTDSLKALQETEVIKRVSELYKQIPEFAAPNTLAIYFSKLLNDTESTGAVA